MKKVKIVHVTQSLGGVKTHLEHVIKYSDRDLFEYIIVAPEHFEFQELCAKHSVGYYPLKLRRGINPFVDLKALFNIVTILRKEQPDVVHTHSAKGGYLGRIAAMFTHAKVIYAPHAFSYLSFKGVKRMVFYSLEFIARKWTDVLLSVSYSEASRAVNEVGFKAENVKVILNSICFDGNLPFKNYASCTKIGMIARLTYQKNPFLFLQIATELLKKYPALEFTILGAGMCDHLSSEINAYLKKNDLEGSIKILKWGEGDKSMRFLKETDIFLLTSVFEGLPYSLLEAMSFGVPCVVSKVDGNTDVINNNENGFSCLYTDEFVSKVEALIKSEELRRAIGLGGYRYAKKVHNVNKNIKHLEELYLRLANQDQRILLNNKNQKQEAVGVETVHLKTSPNI